MGMVAGCCLPEEGRPRPWPIQGVEAAALSCMRRTAGRPAAVVFGGRATGVCVRTDRLVECIGCSSVQQA